MGHRAGQRAATGTCRSTCCRRWTTTAPWKLRGPERRVERACRSPASSPTSRRARTRGSRSTPRTTSAATSAVIRDFTNPGDDLSTTRTGEGYGVRRPVLRASSSTWAATGGGAPAPPCSARNSYTATARRQPGRAARPRLFPSGHLVPEPERFERRQPASPIQTNGHLYSGHVSFDPITAHPRGPERRHAAGRQPGLRSTCRSPPGTVSTSTSPSRGSGTSRFSGLRQQDPPIPAPAPSRRFTAG